MDEKTAALLTAQVATQGQSIEELKSVVKHLFQMNDRFHQHIRALTKAAMKYIMETKELTAREAVEEFFKYYGTEGVEDLEEVIKTTVKEFEL